MKEPIFTQEKIAEILAGQEDTPEKKVEAILSLYNEDLNGLKINRDDLKKEKEATEAKVAELTATIAKNAEDYAKLQKQFEASSSEDLKKAIEANKADIENQYKGILSERENSIKDLAEKLAKAQKNEHSLKCVQDFNKATANFDIEPSSRDYLYGSVYGIDGGNFSERDLGSGLQLLNGNGQTGEQAVRAFLSTDFGKKFLRNNSTGGGAGNTGSQGAGSATVNPFMRDTYNLTKQAELARTDPELYKQMKAAAGA